MGWCGASTTQPTAQNPPELLATNAVDDKVGRRAENFEDVAQFHEEERGGRAALRVVMPNNLQQFNNAVSSRGRGQEADDENEAKPEAEDRVVTA